MTQGRSHHLIVWPKGQKKLQADTAYRTSLVDSETLSLQKLAWHWNLVARPHHSGWHSNRKISAIHNNRSIHHAALIDSGIWPPAVLDRGTPHGRQAHRKAGLVVQHRAAQHTELAISDINMVVRLVQEPPGVGRLVFTNNRDGGGHHGSRLSYMAYFSPSGRARGGIAECLEGRGQVIWRHPWPGTEWHTRQGYLASSGRRARGVISAPSCSVMVGVGSRRGVLLRHSWGGTVGWWGRWATLMGRCLEGVCAGAGWVVAKGRRAGGFRQLLMVGMASHRALLATLPLFARASTIQSF